LSNGSVIPDPPRDGINQGIQVFPQRRVFVRDALASATGSTHAIHEDGGPVLQVCQTGGHGVTRETYRASDHGPPPYPITCASAAAHKRRVRSFK
jgi:hypothetical protein